MTSAISLLEAMVVATAAMIAFAVYRRVMQGATPPAILDNQVIAFGSAWVLTAVFAATFAFEAFSIMPFVHSVIWSVLIALAIHVLIFTIVRTIIPPMPAAGAGEGDAN